MLGVGDAAGRDHGHADGVDERAQGGDVGLGHSAVAADVGVDEAGDAQGLQRGGEVAGAHAAGLGPAVGGDEAVTGVERDDDRAGVVAAQRLDERGVVDGGGAQDDAVDSGVEEAAGPGGVADAAAALHGGAQASDARDVRQVDRVAAAGAVQVNNVQTGRAGVDPALRGIDGVAVEDGLAVVAPLVQPHAATAADVDGGDDLHRVSPLRRPR